MNYAEAAALAMTGKPVSRPHWHWIKLSSRPDKRGGTKRILVICDEEGNAGEKFKPLTSDIDATDWMLAT